MFIINNLIEGQVKKFLGLITWKCLIDYLYAEIVTDVYAYMNHIADYNYLKLFFSWIIFFFFLILDKQIRKGMIKFSYEFLVAMSLIPSLTVWWVRNDSTRCMVLILLYWVIWGVISILLSRSFKYRSCKYVENHIFCNLEENNNIYSTNYIAIMITFILCIGSTLFFSYKYGRMRIFIGLEDVYNYRMVSGNNMSSIEAYWYNWMSSIILPLVLLFFIKNKKQIYAILCCLLMSMNYAIYGNKTMLFMILLTIGVAIISFSDFSAYLINYILFCLNIITFGSCVLEKMHITRWGVALVDRMTSEIAAGHFYYYDFFQNNSLLFLRQSIFRFFSLDTYGSPIGVIIGSNIKYNPTGNYNNFNNGVFSDAYANFGVLGVVIYPILFVISILIFERSLRTVNQAYKYLILCWLLFYCMSIGYFQWLNSGGFFVAIILLKIYKKYRIRI